jgi:hypothetical protein
MYTYTPSLSLTHTDRYLLRDCVNTTLSYNPAFVAQGDILVGYRTGGWFRLVLVGCETQEAGDLLTAVYEKIAPPDVRVHTHLERERQPGE